MGRQRNEALTYTTARKNICNNNNQVLKILESVMSVMKNMSHPYTTLCMCLSRLKSISCFHHTCYGKERSTL